METYLVSRAYTDRIDMSVRIPGEAVELDDQRAEELAARGFVTDAPASEHDLESEPSEAAEPGPEPESDQESEPDPEPEPEPEQVSEPGPEPESEPEEKPKPPQSKPKAAARKAPAKKG